MLIFLLKGALPEKYRDDYRAEHTNLHDLAERLAAGRARVAEAREEACDALEAEARRRAVEGVRKPVYYRGEIVGTVKEYSDTLLIFLMKGAMPEKYRENVKIEHTGGAELLEKLAAGRARVAAAQ